MARRPGTWTDRLFRHSTRLFAGAVVAILVLLALQLAISSREAWATFGLGFVVGSDWNAVQGIYGALPFIAGTLLSSLIALTIATPIGLLTAIFLAELAPRRLAAPLVFAIELLAAIPSVVYGLWGVFVLSPYLQSTIE
jgi:phosphate transport system permease protein